MRRNWLLGAALLLAVASLCQGVTAGALWDPYEVSVAELSRRIGLHLLGGSHLAVSGADNSLPIRADLGRGELPFTSAALGFRLGGLSAVAGRVPLALWALLGAAALFAAVSRLWDRRTALYASLILLTTPLYVLPARVLVGDAVTLATFTLAWSGLTAAASAQVSGRGRAAFAALGAVGLYAGFWCRGPVLSVAAPALAAGVPALLAARRGAPGRGVALASVGVGLAALAAGASGLSLARRTAEYSVFVGTAVAARPVPSTFDLSLGDLTHAAFPFSALAPLALLAAVRADDERERHATGSAVLGLGLGLAATAWLMPHVGPVPVPSVACLAVLVARGLRRLETSQLPSRALAVVVAALGVVVALDFRANPDKLLVAYGLGPIKLPEGLTDSASALALGGALTLAASALFCLGEPERRPGEARSAFERAEYGRILRALREAHGGNLMLALLAVETGLVGFLLLSALSERVAALPQLDGFGTFSRRLAAAAAIALPLLPVAVLGVVALRDLARVIFSGTPRALTRAQGLLLGVAAFGLAQSLGFYPALARQVSPAEAVERYRELARPGEGLAVLGQDAAASRYQGAPTARGFDDPGAAFAWLTEPALERRWLVLRRDDLAEMSSRFRGARGSNLPILDARSSELLLATSALRAGERNQTPLGSIVLERVPQPQHPLRATLGDELEVLGFSLRDEQGRLLEALVPNQPARLTLYFRVRGRLRGTWQIFVHLDGLQRRFNADHEPFGGKYPARYWLPGDILADTTELRLEPHFAPGSYRLYFGFFTGERRLTVRDGEKEDDRVSAGALQVR